MSTNHTPRIAVVGSLNMDLVLQVQHAPGPGETSASGRLFAPVWWPARFAEPAGDSGVRVQRACRR